METRTTGQNLITELNTEEAIHAVKAGITAALSLTNSNLTISDFILVTKKEDNNRQCTVLSIVKHENL